MKFEFSAGGVVYKRSPSTSSGLEQVVILLAQHGVHHGWVFPKGLIEGRNPSTASNAADAGSGQAPETKEHAAVREVEEETGVLARLGQPLTPVTYWYQWTEKEKTVLFSHGVCV
jgi:8-oxo-dGTP pyrophosphatase MutT (NUDIX family)